MPQYYCKDGLCAKTRTDEEKKQGGFMNGDCVSASCMKFKELTKKFGNHFSIAMLVLFRNTCSIVRLMNDDEYKKFMGKGRYMIHFKIYNMKTRQYIDTSQDSVLIESVEHVHHNFNHCYNQLYKIYHFSLEYIVKHRGGDMTFLYDYLENQEKNPISNKVEKKMINQGVVILTQ